MFSSLTMRAHAEAVRPCFSGNVPWKDGYEPHYWIRSIVLVFRIERMTGFEPAVSCLGSRRAATAPHPHCRVFSDTSHGGDVLSAGRKRMAGFRVDALGITPREKVWIPSSSNALRPFLPVVTDVLIPPAGAAGRTARASSRPGEIHGKRYSHASRIDRIRTCDPMLPKHVRYQTAPQSDIFDRTPWLTSYVRALLNAISSDSGTVLSSTTMLSS